MFDRNSSYNRRPNQSSSYEEDDFLDAQDQQERHSDRGARSRQSSRSERESHANSSNQSNFKQAAQSAFGSLASLASRYVSFGDSGSAAGGNHARRAASRSQHENFEYQDGHIDRNIDRIAVSELIVRSEEVEQVVLIDLIVLDILNTQACAVLMKKIGLLVMSDVMILVLLRAIVSRVMLLWQTLRIVAETLPRCVIVMVML